MIVAVDLFCGAGGLTCGLSKGGIKVKAGVDVDPSCKFPYEFNNSSLYIEQSVSELVGSDIKKYLDEGAYTLLAGCAPCQPFSKYSRGQILDRDKWGLLNHFTRLIAELSPDFVTMENVPQLIKHKVFKLFLSKLKKLKYYVDYKIVYCPDYGIPQARSRLILIASKHSRLSILPPTHAHRKSEVTVRNAIGKLKNIAAGESDSRDRLHVARKLSDINLKRIQSSVPGGTWRDWPEELRVSCHKKKTGATFPSVYGRMEWDRPSPTITTQFFGYGNGRFGHPEQDRAISIREGAILQSFPKNYQFSPRGEDINTTEVGKMIGNAVPVRLGEIIAKSFVAHVANLN